MVIVHTCGSRTPTMNQGNTGELLSKRQQSVYLCFFFNLHIQYVSYILHYSVSYIAIEFNHAAFSIGLV